MNTYSKQYIEDCRAKLTTQIAAFDHLAALTEQQSALVKGQLAPALATVETIFFNNLVLALENYFVHRSRTIEGKDGNALNEVRLLCNSMMANNGIFTGEKAIKFDPAKSTLKQRFGEEIKVTKVEFVKLLEAFFAELESKFLAPEAVPTN